MYPKKLQRTTCLCGIVHFEGKCGIRIADVTSEDWDFVPHTRIDVRRGFVVRS